MVGADWEEGPGEERSKYCNSNLRNNKHFRQNLKDCFYFLVRSADLCVPSSQAHPSSVVLDIFFTVSIYTIEKK